LSSCMNRYCLKWAQWADTGAAPLFVWGLGGRQKMKFKNVYKLEGLGTWHHIP